MRARALRLLHVLPIAAAMLPAVAWAATPSPSPIVPSTLPPAYIVALDPGHGGTADNNHPEKLWDPGAISATNVMEKDLTLDVARRVRALLQRDLVSVLMTRDSDTYVDISPRMEAANRAGAGIFVSIHFNSFTDPMVQGSVVLYPTDANIPFAQTMSDALNRQLAPFGFQDNGILAKPDLWVHAQMPAVTVEAGYLSNPEDTLRLGDPRARDALAAAILRGIETQAPEIAQRKAAILAYRAAHPEVAVRGSVLPAGARHLAASWGWELGLAAVAVGLAVWGRARVAHGVGAALARLGSPDRRVARSRRRRATRVRRRAVAQPTVAARRRPVRGVGVRTRVP
ncbi:MAG TPA: N-acetylmuramoyl-L-alanine amidase [Candidatus Dormibacteraeota bacterium]|jgi:N-acetylmuramoyl-L-alanine amidase|nr:N-acetylmuramoyl-L-alanine amidase [Candidatus Dormibacteraeota bacterium]